MTTTSPLDVARLRRDFPVLERRIEDRRLVYLDSAATSLKPRQVVDAVVDYYSTYTANVHRGKHTLSEESSEAFEGARATMARHIGAGAREIVFTSGTTHALNLVALGLELGPGANVVTTRQEHHSNLTPWFGRAEVRVVPVAEDGVIDIGRVLDAIDERTRVVAISGASNATGALHPVRELSAEVKERGPLVVVDAAQWLPHERVDVTALGCDFFAFSAHKMLGPTGIGALWGRSESLRALGTPLRGGGMVDLVTADGFTAKTTPFSLEPGTPHIAGAIGFAAAVRYLEALDAEAVAAHERRLAERLYTALCDLPGTRLLGPSSPGQRLALASLVINSTVLSADHVAMMLSDTHKIMARSGHHCCHPYFDALGAPGSLRLSAYLYNTEEEIDFATSALRDILGGLTASGQRRKG